MKPAHFQYFRPETVEAVLALLDEDAKVLAGGQSLMPLLNLRALTPNRLVDINGVKGLDLLTREAGVLRVGAAVRQATVEQSPWAQGLMRTALHQVALPVVRNRGTIAGSLCQQDPAAEMGAVARVYDTRFVIGSPRGRRVVNAAQWFVDYYTTCLAPDELLLEVHFGLEPEGVGTAFHEINRGHGAFALVGCATWVRMQDGSAVEVRAALCGVGPVPVALDVATGWKAAVDAVEEVAVLACRDLKPWEDTAAPAWYRKQVAPVLLARALQEAAFHSVSVQSVEKEDHHG